MSLMPSLTKTGRLVLGLLVLLYLGALQSETGLVFFLLGLLCGLFVLNAASAAWSLRALVVELPPAITAFEGGPIEEGWTVRNRSRRPAGLATVEGPFGPMLRAGLLAPGEALTRIPSGAAGLRGVVPFSCLKLASAYPFGLVRLSRHLDLPGELIVYPAVYVCEPPPAAGHEPMVGGRHGSGRLVRSGAHFAGVRPFQTSDPPRAIHWRASARGAGLMVKEFDEELSGRVAILVGGRAAPAPKKGTTLDWAARAAGSLLLAALDQGHHVELLELGALEPLAVPPFSDGLAALERLARLAPEPRAPRRERLEAALHAVAARSALAFVLTEAGPDLAELLGSREASRRKLSVYLPAGAPAFEAPDGVRMHRFGSDHIEPGGAR
jgi:uncharacterized protein (DUF58 family)